MPYHSTVHFLCNKWRDVGTNSLQQLYSIRGSLVDLVNLHTHCLMIFKGDSQIFIASSLVYRGAIQRCIARRLLRWLLKEFINISDLIGPLLFDKRASA